jgi:hypothetical protein
MRPGGLRAKCCPQQKRKDEPEETTVFSINPDLALRLSRERSQRLVAAAEADALAGRVHPPATAGRRLRRLRPLHRRAPAIP